MISMTTDILLDCKGKFWLQAEDLSCELHLTASVPIEEEAKAAFIAASTKKANSPVRGIKNKISALFSGMLSCGDYPELYMSMDAGFIGGMPAGMPLMHAEPVWSLSAYEKSLSHDRKAPEMDGVEKSILSAVADDVIVSVKSNWAELIVKKKFELSEVSKMPKFSGLSHICIFVDELSEAVAYYQKLLGAVPDHFLWHWKNEGFFKAAGFIDWAKDGEVSIAFLNIPGTKLTLELMQYHNPKGRKNPVFFAANDVSGARHVALKITNIDEAFQHIKHMPDTRLINTDGGYKVFKISETKPSEVQFFGQEPGKIDERNEETANILSNVRYFYFIDKYGLQWEFEQGHTDIGD